ncbi:hypothetical protein SUVZ_06G0330 [Saccharomyces uvarum]|uniref:Uncharacterized protein n=1 Tax=Saccharomyces uvarum TaxID=230603 RepID=A0ABN8WYK5_SACUV|nr:hypothetical protein SUVZ_06G0330 [Saccharomyces uvarum]
MEKTKDIEHNASLDQDEIPESRFFVILEKLSKVSCFVIFWINYATPILFYLADQYPKAATIGLVRIGLTLAAIPIILTCKFLLWKNGPFKSSDRREPKRCSKVTCPTCAFRKQHPKWFEFKYLSLVLIVPGFSIYFFAFKINYFFKDNQTVDLYRLLQLLGWEIGMIFSGTIPAFCHKQVELHNGPLEVNEKEAMPGSEMV